jgi:hypothetical protein
VSGIKTDYHSNNNQIDSSRNFESAKTYRSSENIADYGGYVKPNSSKTIKRPPDKEEDDSNSNFENKYETANSLSMSTKRITSLHNSFSYFDQQQGTLYVIVL